MIDLARCAGGCRTRCLTYTLDTNVVVDALRRPAELQRLKASLSWALPDTVLSAIVASELFVALRSQVAGLKTAPPYPREAIG